MGEVLFCTDTIRDRYGDEIRRRRPGVEIIALEGSSRIMSPELERITAAFFSGDAWPDRSANVMQVCLHSPRLQWLHTFSAGVDHPVFGSFVERGVLVTTSSGSSASPIAQTVMMYLLALTRDLPGWLRAQAEQRWVQRGITELEGLRLGIVGMGPIGYEVARLGTAFGMRPIGLRRTVRGDEPCETWSLVRLPELAGSVDVLVLALPLAEETRGLVDGEILGMLRPGALFVNVGRGEVVDESALVEALRSGNLGGAGLDVFAVEPLPDDSPLWSLPNVIITPHSSGTSTRAHERAAEIFLDNLARREAGEPLQNLI